MSNVHDHRPVATRAAVQDPVCGMDVDPSTTEHHVQPAALVSFQPVRH